MPDTKIVPAGRQKLLARALGTLMIAAFAAGAYETVHILTSYPIGSAIVLLVVAYICLIVIVALLSMVIRAVVLAGHVGVEAARAVRK